jgi:hypothetical protein
MMRRAASTRPLIPNQKEHTMSTTPNGPSTTAESAAADRKPRRTPLYVTIAAWAVPVMVLGQFAMLAILPLAVVVVAAFVDARARALRWWVGALALAYATPLAIWLLRPDGAQSLSKDIHPLFVALIVALSAVLLLKIHWRRRPPASTQAK